MVVQGNFKVELIDATTKQPFKEHTSKGKTYAEVEPDAEYFIRITTSYPSTVKAYLKSMEKIWGIAKEYHMVQRRSRVFGLEKRGRKLRQPFAFRKLPSWTVLQVANHGLGVFVFASSRLSKQAK